MTDTDNNTLVEIIKRVRSGDKKAFDELYNSTVRYAYATAAKILKNQHNIEDALQNSYLYVSNHINDLNNPEAFLSWLRIIVIHECQNMKNEQSKFLSFITSRKNQDLLPEDKFDDFVSNIERVEEIGLLLKLLTDDKREIITLRYIDDMSYAQIAKKLDIPIGTVMSRLHNAKKQLEKEYKKLQEKDKTLKSIAIIPLLASLLAFESAKSTIPFATQNGVIANTGAASSSAATGTGVVNTATTVSSAATGGAASSVATATAVTSSVATKIIAGVVAASVATGGAVTAKNAIQKGKAEKTDSTAVISDASNTYDTIKNMSEKTSASYITEIEPGATYTLNRTENSTEAVKAKEKPETASTGNKKISSEESSGISSEENSTHKSEQSHSSSKDTTKSSTTSKSTATTKSTTTTAKSSTSTESTTTTAKSSTSTKSTTTTAKSSSSSESTTTAAKSSTSTKSTTTTAKSSTFSESTTTNAKSTTIAESTTVTTLVPTEPTVKYEVNSLGTLTSFEGKSPNLIIPETVNGQTVKAIGSGTFSGNKEIISVTMPSTVTKIGQAAFSDCISLVSVNLSSNTVAISDDAFDGCSSLMSINIPESCKSIGEYAFADCTSLKRITINSKTTQIGEDAFYGSDDVVINCPKESVAEEFAKENNIKYSII